MSEAILIEYTPYSFPIDENSHENLITDNTKLRNENERIKALIAPIIGLSLSVIVLAITVGCMANLLANHSISEIENQYLTEIILESIGGGISLIFTIITIRMIYPLCKKPQIQLPSAPVTIELLIENIALHGSHFLKRTVPSSASMIIKNIMSKMGPGNTSSVQTNYHQALQFLLPSLFPQQGPAAAESIQTFIEATNKLTIFQLVNVYSNASRDGWENFFWKHLPEDRAQILKKFTNDVHSNARVGDV